MPRHRLYNMLPSSEPSLEERKSHLAKPGMEGGCAAEGVTSDSHIANHHAADFAEPDRKDNLQAEEDFRHTLKVLSRGACRQGVQAQTARLCGGTYM